MKSPHLRAHHRRQRDAVLGGLENLQRPKTPKKSSKKIVLPSITIDAASLKGSPQATYTVHGLSGPAKIAVTPRLQSEETMRCVCCREPFPSHAAYRQHKQKHARHCVLHKNCGPAGGCCPFCYSEWVDFSAAAWMMSRQSRLSRLWRYW